MKRWNVLITGAGDDIGMSLAKILRKENYDFIGEIFGSDMSCHNPSRFEVSQTFLVPAASSASYESEIRKIVLNRNIGLIIPASEAEIKYYSENLNVWAGTQKILIPNPEIIKIGFDKYQTYLLLKENGFLYPETILLTKGQDLVYPCVIKRRSGSGSKDVLFAGSLADLSESAIKKTFNSDYICQEDLLSNDEYTCSVFRHGTMLRSFISKRDLKNGITVYGKVEDNMQIERLLKEIAETVNLEGSINIQLKLTKRGPIVFEINPRFSSTVMFRHLLGFKDFEWSLKKMLGVEVKDEYIAKIGAEFFRSYEEYVQIN